MEKFTKLLTPLLSVLIFAALYFFGVIAFYRVLALSSVIGSIYTGITKSVPFGPKGSDPKFYLTGKNAVILSIATSIIFLAIALYVPEIYCFLKSNYCNCSIGYLSSHTLTLDNILKWLSCRY